MFYANKLASFSLIEDGNLNISAEIAYQHLVRIPESQTILPMFLSREALGENKGGWIRKRKRVNFTEFNRYNKFGKIKICC